MPRGPAGALRLARAVLHPGLGGPGLSLIDSLNCIQTYLWLVHGEGYEYQTRALKDRGKWQQFVRIWLHTSYFLCMGGGRNVAD